MSKIYLDILNPEQKKIFEKLQIFRRDGVLGGGTAVGKYTPGEVKLFFEKLASKYLKTKL